MPWLIAMLAAAASAAAAPGGDDALAARFATRPTATSVALSPLGDKIAYVGAYREGGRAVFVADLKTGDSNAILAGASLSLSPEHCNFKTETRLICRMYGILDNGEDFSRLLAVDIDGQNRTLIGAQTDSGRFGGGVVDWLPDDPDHVLVALAGVSTVDVHTGKATPLGRESSNVIAVGSDGHGRIRFRQTGSLTFDGYRSERSEYSVLPKGGGPWQPLVKVALSDERRPEFAGFDEGGDHVFLLAPQDGRQALFSVAADGSNVRTLVFAHPEVDVDDVLRIGKYRRPVAATFTTERLQFHYFDPQLTSLSASLRRALPDHPDVSILDESWDGAKKLVYVDGDARPGHYLLYDAATRRLGALMSTYPELDTATFGSVHAVRYAAHDGTMIPAYLTLPPGHADARGLPAIVMPHGGPAARDTAGFDWFAQFFAAEGYAVLQPNFRGSTGYGEAFFASNGYRSWPLAIGDVNDGARWLIAQGVPAARLAIVGWSYGGYAALQANVVEPDLYRAAVAVAPVTDLQLERTLAYGTTDYKLVASQIGRGRLIIEGSPARNAAKIKAPVLMFHGDKDLNVAIAHSRAMAAALRKANGRVELVEYKGLDHQLDDSAVRARMLARSAAFLRSALN